MLNCFYCGTPLSEEGGADLLAIAYRAYKRVSDPGLIDSEVLWCKPCISRKLDMTLEEFRALFPDGSNHRFWGETH